MSKRKVYNYTRRTLAFLMAMIMTLSVVQSSSMTAFAQTGSDVVVTETEAVDVIEETSVTNTEEVSSEILSEENEESVAEPETSEVSSETEEVSSEAVEETTEVIETTEAATIAETEEMTVEVVETVPAVDVMEDGEAYTGDEFTEDNRAGIEIAEYKMTIPEESDFETEANTILSNLENKYEIISLCYSSITDTVDADLWNAALGKLNSDDDQTVSIRVNFSGGENAPDENWNFDNPGTAEADVKLGVSIELSTESNGGATFKLDEGTTVGNAAQDICVNFCADENGRATTYSAYQAAFGSKTAKWSIYDAEENLLDNANAYYESSSDDNGNYFNLSVNGIQSLSVNTAYTLSEYVYKGNYNEWDDNGYTFQSLYIQPAEVDKTSFTAEEISSILSNYDEKSFDEITIVYRTDAMGGTVDDAVINATLPYLKESSEDRKSCTRIAFQNTTTNEEFTWILVNPGEQIEDQTLTASFAVADGVATVSVGSQSFVAEGVNITVSRSNESDAEGVTALKTIYGETPTRLLVGDTDVPAGFDMDDWSVWIWIDDISQLTPNTTYTIEKYTYIGNIDTWEDGTRELSIHAGIAGAETFTEDELNTILGNYSKEDQIDCIYIGQARTDNNIIYKSVADKAASLLCNEEYGEVKFGFRDVHTDQTVEWQLAGKPSEIVQTADQTVKANLIVGEEENALYVSVGAQSLVANEVRVLFNTSVQNENEKADEFIIGLFGEEEIQIETEGGETPGWYYVNEEHVCIGIGNPRVLTADQFYKIVKKEYCGDVNEDLDGTSLYISAHELEKDTFDTASLKKIVDYWVGRGVTFDNVSIEQTFTSNNIVKKDLFNAARPLLASEESGLTFVFCGCQMAEQDENGEETKPYIQSDMNWHFQGITKNATKDINANVSVVKKGGGVSAVLKSNTYPSKHTHVQFWMSEDADMVQNVLVPAFGKAKPQSSLVVLEKAATLKTLSNGDMPASYDGNEGMVNLFLANVEEWKAGIDNRLVEAYERPEAPIGEQADVMLFTYDPNDPEDPSYPPEDENAEWSHPDQPKANIKFSLLTPDIATMGYRVNEKGTRYDYVIPNVPWKTVYTLCTYTSVSDEACVEVLAYPTTVDISGIAFAEEVIDIEWDGSNPEHYGYLGININPRAAQNHFNTQEFTWTVTQSEE